MTQKNLLKTIIFRSLLQATRRSCRAWRTWLNRTSDKEFFPSELLKFNQDQSTASLRSTEVTKNERIIHQTESYGSHAWLYSATRRLIFTRARSEFQ